MYLPAEHATARGGALPQIAPLRLHDIRGLFAETGEIAGFA